MQPFQGYFRHKPVRIHFGEEKSRTKENHKDECDVNRIVAKAQRNGFFPPAPPDPMYGDFTQVKSYHESMNTVLHAQEQFANLPAKVRARFANDPAEFLAFTADPSNIDEMVSLGLATRRKVDAAPTPTSPAPASPPPVQGGKKGSKTPPPSSDDGNS